MRDNNKQSKIAENFDAAGRLFVDMGKRYKRLLNLGLLNAEELCRPYPTAMAEIYRTMDYSQRMFRSVHQAATEAGEAIRADRYYIMACDHWDAITNDVSRLEDFSQAMQKKMDRALGKQREWGTYKREISFDLSPKEPYTSFFGDKLFPLGSFSFEGVDKYDPETLKGRTWLNTHPGTAIQSPSLWLSIQFHEIVHGMESVERTIRANRYNGYYGDDNDGQLLAVDNWYLGLREFGHRCHDAYFALPKERLARAGQTVLQSTLEQSTRPKRFTA